MVKTIFQYQQIGRSVLKLRKKRPQQTRKEMIAESERNIFKDKLLKSFMNALEKKLKAKSATTRSFKKRIDKYLEAERAKEDYLKIIKDYPQYDAKVCSGKFDNSYYVRIKKEY